jgi:hypothetical protein
MKSWPKPHALFIYPSPHPMAEAVAWGATRQSSHEFTASKNHPRLNRCFTAP